MAVDHETLTPGPDHLDRRAPAGQIAHTYRRLVFVGGLRPREAASLLGRMEGLPMVQDGWTLGEVERLLFVRALVSVGRMGS